MEVETTNIMEQVYETFMRVLSGLLEPAPLNQLGMPEYYRHILQVLAQAKTMIEQLEVTYRDMLPSYEIEEEF